MTLRKNTLRWVVLTLAICLAILLAVFVVATKEKSPKYDPKAVDSSTIEYLESGNFAADIINSDSRIATIDNLKITRQDDIPIAIVSYTFKPEFEESRSAREFYYFEYQTICSVAAFANSHPDLSLKQISEQFSLPEPQIRAMLKIAKQSRRKR